MDEEVTVTSLHELMTKVFLDGLHDRDVHIVGLENPAHITAAQNIYDLGRYLHQQFKGAQAE